MRASEILTAALNLIVDPANHCRGRLAETKDGTMCDPTDLSAVRFCAFGALDRARTSPLYGIGDAYLNRAAKKLFAAEVVDVNDKHEHDDTIQMYQMAIRMAKGDEV